MIGLRSQLAAITAGSSLLLPATPCVAIGSRRHNAYCALRALAKPLRWHAGLRQQ